ncbi:poly(A) polymerase Cid12 [Schizosaccharomyces pombe]|uniref:Poly(A) RNA polymerase cid12 n=1 Tax=Schizosaccharomyces pombe (strain 972 / ATCC 24843) TaxID=284812 RepID=CID12_SCHPO|nr:poly(A) polymerase Cid12 [Schizosaccharomyces pombe]O74518.1 RecName: Full=Poly(A) RNA polymerase cid12; Short=PAP; AltName: Full=Caffeine-induced death protein 12; AltName: Full=Polynucleotide adenylyltransferase cid12 [Schizosaccharomyces pombe 972h-]CAA20372.1 poly(A) polymerase Cid12 [Schizosaccharomyces pombe]|eukprot:NP_588273.1 poly(A) polymerase Cid12 [Schizosaccharomyces pombe]
MGKVLLELHSVPWNEEGLSDNARLYSFLEFVSPKIEELKYRKLLLEKLQTHIREVVLDAELQVYGSMYIGTTLSISDVDVSLKSPRVGELEKRRVTMVLRKYLDADADFHSSARVPRINLVDVSGIGVDLTFGNDKACRTAELQKAYNEEHPIFGRLLMLLKHWLFERDLENVHHGGIASCALSYMLIGWLEMRFHKKGIDSEVQPIRALLQKFFYFWGVEWTYELFVLRPLTGQIVPKLQKGWLNEVQPNLLSIEDPIDRNNDIGKQSFQISMIKAAFVASANELLSDKTWFSTFAITEDEMFLCKQFENVINTKRSLVEGYDSDTESDELQAGG